jgi:hypothetical protein
VATAEAAKDPKTIARAFAELGQFIEAHKASSDVLAKACVERLGIDVPKWAGEIREKVATAKERTATRQHCKVLLGCSTRKLEPSSTDEDMRLRHIVQLLGIALERIDALEDR